MSEKAGLTSTACVYAAHCNRDWVVCKAGSAVSKAMHTQWIGSSEDIDSAGIMQTACLQVRNNLLKLNPNPLHISG